MNQTFVKIMSEQCCHGNNIKMNTTFIFTAGMEYYIYIYYQALPYSLIKSFTISILKNRNG